MLNIKSQKIIITTGGTGGHIFPARVLAEELYDGGCKVKILANKNYNKYTHVSDKYDYNIIFASQIKKSFKFLFLAAIKIFLGIFQSFFRILFFRPKYIIAFGGYATFPVLCAAFILRKKTILHEQNAHLGKINRIFAPFATKILLTYKNTDGLKKEFKKKSFVVGSPARQNITKLSKVKYQLPVLNNLTDNNKNMGYNLLLKSDFELQKREENSFFNILIIGGSGGAEIFSEVIPKAIFNLRSEIKNDVLIMQQCRENIVESTLKQYRKFKINIVIGSFFNDMEDKIKSAHLVISRAGSSSISEFTIAKRPLILVPFANSADNHQLKNAREVEKKSSAIVIEEHEFTINKLNDIITKLFDNPEILLEMSKNAYKSAHKNSVDKIIKKIFDE
jgi:UDP-N-acetylglucosamine--N-acetylmuramyl-(pentapeptide) pyrophosphoryl-undecaprenol N-acetylglucosamine transferase|tara:strand:- start:1496 stop:2671 length:1176 start_codon:yes stop_codon:yes gene_type:complete